VGKVKRCSSEGCVNQAKKGGVCIKHGAKVKVCTIEGCTSLAKIAGVCFLGMGRNTNTNCAAVKDALIIPRKEDCVSAMAEYKKEIVHQ